MYTNVCPDVGQEQNIWQLPRGATCIRAISSWEMKISFLAMWTRESPNLQSAKILKIATSMQKRHVRNVLRGSTALAAVRQTPITSKGKIDDVFTKWAASWNVSV